MRREGPAAGTFNCYVKPSATKGFTNTGQIRVRFRAAFTSAKRSSLEPNSSAPSCTRAARRRVR